MTRTAYTVLFPLVCAATIYGAARLESPKGKEQRLSAGKARVELPPLPAGYVPCVQKAIPYVPYTNKMLLATDSYPNRGGLCVSWDTTLQRFTTQQWTFQRSANLKTWTTLGTTNRASWLHVSTNRLGFFRYHTFMQ